jgi:hypothetical protein
MQKVDAVAKEKEPEEWATDKELRKERAGRTTT